MASSDPWVIPFKRNPKAAVRLFCIPYAGAGALVYRSWAEGLPPEIEVCGIQLPGRETRFRENPLLNIEPLVRTLGGVLYPYYLDRAFAFFGHSLGAVIGFELVQALMTNYGVNAMHLFASSRIAPDLSDPRPSIHKLSDTEFKNKLRELNGTPEELLSNPEMAAMLAVLRADFCLNENYSYRSRPPLAVPISAYGGLDDPKVTQGELQGWERHTAKSFDLRVFPGDHFYLHSSRPLLLRAIASRLISGL